MAKAYSMGAKRRAKKASAPKKAGLPKLAEVPKRAKTRGRARMRELEDDAQSAMLGVRARQVGSDNQDAMRSVMLGESAGQALYLSLGEDEARALWGHYTALTAAQRRYHLSMGLSIHAKTAKVESQPEVFEARDDQEIDLRTEDERDEAAARAWGVWSDLIKGLGLAHASAIQSAAQGFGDLVLDGSVTQAGGRFVKAMQALDMAVAKKTGTG